MGVKKNILYTSFLTLSNYIFGLITFPYIARTLGVNNMGIVEFTNNIVAYFLLFASLGINTLGIREIAKVKNDTNELNKCFSSLLFINIFYTLISLCIYFILIFVVDKFLEYKILFLIGSFQIISTTFMVEWLFKGLENFKYIAFRNFAIKIIYIVLVFCLIRESEDYVLYFLLTVGSVIVNAVVNILYSKRFVFFSLKMVSLKFYLKSTLFLGLYSLLTSMYTTFNVAFLGFVSTSTEVGYYATALKVYIIIMGLYTAFTTVMMPRGSALLAEGKRNEFNLLIKKSFETLYTLCFPLIIFCTILSPQIINLLAGENFSGSILPMRTVMPLLLVVGVAQILVLQVIIPARKDLWTLWASALGAVIGIILNIVLVPIWHSEGTSISLVFTEISVTILYVFFVYKSKLIVFDWKNGVKHLLFSLPYIIFCLSFSKLENSYFVLLLSGVTCGIYFFVSQLYIIKNELLWGVLKSLNINRKYGCYGNHN